MIPSLVARTLFDPLGPDVQVLLRPLRLLFAQPLDVNAELVKNAAEIGLRLVRLPHAPS